MVGVDHHHDGGDTAASPSSPCAPSVQRHLLEQLEANRMACLEQLEDALRSPEAVGTMNGGVLPAMQLLADYVTSVVASYTDLGQELSKSEQRLSQVASIDKASLQDLRSKNEQLEHDRLSDRHRYEERIGELEEEVRLAQERQAEAENQLRTQRMEFAMYQSQSKSRVGEISQHKKILKKEVIDLRKRIEEMDSEKDAVRHETERIATTLETEVQRNATLERYVERIEKQVSVQQNMMEMMSQTGSVRDGSILGKVVGPSPGGNDDGHHQQQRSVGVSQSAAAAATAPSSSDKGRRNRLPRSYRTPTKTPAASGSGRIGYNEEVGVDMMPPKSIDVDLVQSAPPVDDAEQINKSPGGAVATQSSAVTSPVSLDASPRTPKITLEDEAVCNVEPSSPLVERSKPSMAVSGDRNDMSKEETVDRTAASTANITDESRAFRDSSVPDEAGFDPEDRDGQEGVPEAGEENPEKERRISNNASGARRSRKERYQRIMQSNLGSSVGKYRADEIIDEPHAKSMTKSSSGYHDNSRLSDQVLQDTIRDYERSRNADDDDDDFDNMDDAKSHISELTEDRTYKLPYQEQPLSYKVPRDEGEGNGRVAVPMPPIAVQSSQGALSRGEGEESRKERDLSYPPRYILGKGENADEKSFVSSKSRPIEGRPPHANSSPFRSSSHRRVATRDEDGSIGPYSMEGISRLSVAERARIYAQRGSNTVTVRTSPSPSPQRHRGRTEQVRHMGEESSTDRTRSNSPSGRSRGSFLANVGRRVVTAIDNSVLGVPDMAGRHRDFDDESGDDDSSASSGSSGGSGSSGRGEAGRSDYSNSSAEDDEHSKQLKEEVGTPLHIRQKIQREKQLEFLKKEGIIKN